MTSDFNICHGKMVELVLFSFFGFTLVIKLRSFYFESHWNTLIFFDKKRKMSDLNMSCQLVSGSGARSKFFLFFFVLFVFFGIPIDIVLN